MADDPEPSPKTDDPGPATEPELVDHAGIRVIPPVAYALCLAFGFGVNAYNAKDHMLDQLPWLSWLGLPLVILGLAFGIWGIKRFRFHGVDPHAGTGSVKLVLTGAYKYSRNPMYVGLLTMHMGIILLTQNFWLLVTWPFLLLYLRLHVIRREELYLCAKFGEEYQEFYRRVRRWF